MARTRKWLVALVLPALGATSFGIQAAVAPAGVDIQPGPAALTGPLPRAPQFENTGIWQAAPIRISGASAYRAGEFLYQDFLYDDRGASTNGNGGATVYARSGKYTYPTDVNSYFENLADFVEVRLKLTPAETAFRLTYNSMSDASLVGASIAIGGAEGVLRTVPFGANAVEPADIFVTVHGTVAVVTDAATGNTLGTFAAAVDTDRRQIEFRVPFTLYDPRGRQAVRVAAATGLWNGSTGAYKIPAVTATATMPGGVGTNTPNAPAFFNVAFRYNEPNPAGTTYTRWRDGVQGTVLATTVAVNGVQTHDLSPFFATVDFVKLASGVDDDLVGQPMGAETNGFLNRIVSSRYEVIQGVGNPAAADLTIHKQYGCTPTSLRSADGLTSCIPQFAGRLQPYSLYVPMKAPPATGYGVISDLHGGGDNYQRNPPVTPERSAGLAESGTGFLMFITEGRGGRYYWGGQAGSEIWEVLQDIKRFYKVDPDKIVAGGISQGGNGTWKEVLSFPDVFAAAIPHVPCPSGGLGYTGTNAPGGPGTFALPMIESLRNVPIIVSAGEADTTCSWAGPMGNIAIRAKLDTLPFKFEFWSFPGMGHQFAMQACNGISQKPCAYTFETDFLESLGTLKRAVNPSHVTLATSDGLNEPLWGFDGDHAYWLSGVKVRDASIFYGKVDVKSWGFGLNDPEPSSTQKITASDYAAGQNISYHTYNRWIKTLGAATPTAAADRVDITATNIRKVVIDPVRARITCNAVVNVTQTDGPIEVVIHGCVAGDIDLDDSVGCTDLIAARGMIGARSGDGRYNSRADMDNNGVIDIRDIAAIARLVPGGTTCTSS